MILLLLPCAFIPMVIAFIWLRNTERYSRESWKNILIVFIWGATSATALAFVLENLIASSQGFNFLMLSVIIAPLVEESAKPLILRFMKKDINELEDGLIFGAVAGLGFAATENLLYGILFWDEGIIVILALFYLRTLGSGLLHASATALTGYGYSTTLLQTRSRWSIIPFFTLAVIAHSIFNLLAYSAQTIHHILGVVLSVLLAVILLFWTRKTIITLDRKNKVSTPQ